MKHKILLGEGILLVIAVLAVFFIYPRTDANVSGNAVKFETANANLIILSENPDFTNPRYIELGKSKNISVYLKPGTYYWKASNDLIEGLRKEVVVESSIGLKIDTKENSSEITNVGNVKINVSRNKEGKLVGRIILEPEQAEQIENSGEYTGRQA